MCFECRFPLMSICNPDVIESRSEIELCEVFGSLEFLKEVFNAWDRGSVTDGVLIQFAVVLYSSVRGVFLVNPEER